MPRWLCFGLLMITVAALCGCSSNQAPTPVPVQGTVYLDGKYMPEGDITFVGEAGRAPETLPIKDGKFEGPVAPGKVRVEIRANKMGKETKMGDTIIPASPENYLPAKYNSESTLTAVVG